MFKQNVIKITADDYGYCFERNKGIRELAHHGIITSTSVLVNTDFVEVNIAEEKICLGLHLNLTEGFPVSDPNNTKSLLDSEHGFLGKHGFREKLQKDLIDISEVTAECIAQIEKFKTLFGFLPKYIDGHQHVHVLPGVRNCLANCMIAYGINETRLPYEIAIEKCNWIESSRLNFYSEVCRDAKQAEKEWKDKRIKFPPYFIGLSVMSRDLTLDRLERAFNLIHERSSSSVNQSIESATVEIMCHPGYPSKENIGGCGRGPDDFSKSLNRLHELYFFKSSEFGNCIVKNVDILIKGKESHNKLY